MFSLFPFSENVTYGCIYTFPTQHRACAAEVNTIKVINVYMTTATGMASNKNHMTWYLG